MVDRRDHWFWLEKTNLDKHTITYNACTTSTVSHFRVSSGGDEAPPPMPSHTGGSRPLSPEIWFLSVDAMVNNGRVQTLSIYLLSPSELAPEGASKWGVSLLGILVCGVFSVLYPNLLTWRMILSYDRMKIPYTRMNRQTIQRVHHPLCGSQVVDVYSSAWLFRW